MSPGSSASHAKSAAEYGLPFTWPADEQEAACGAYGVWKVTRMYGRQDMGGERTTIVIARDGKVARVFPLVKVPRHAEAVLEAVRSLG